MESNRELARKHYAHKDRGDWYALWRPDATLKAAGPLAHCQAHQSEGDLLVKHECEVCHKDNNERLVSLKNLDGTVSYRHVDCLHFGFNV